MVQGVIVAKATSCSNVPDVAGERLAAADALGNTRPEQYYFAQ